MCRTGRFSEVGLKVKRTNADAQPPASLFLYSEAGLFFPFMRKHFEQTTFRIAKKGGGKSAASNFFLKKSCANIPCPVGRAVKGKSEDANRAGTAAWS
jgi:hypothetical protein